LVDIQPSAEKLEEDELVQAIKLRLAKYKVMEGSATAERKDGVAAVPPTSHPAAPAAPAAPSAK
jgi:hypothetical protein